MGVKVGQVRVNFITNTAQFETDLKKITGSLRKSGREFTAAGQALTKHLTLPLVAFGAVAVKASTDFNRSMANVGTLIPGNISRINELKKAIQETAIATASSTQDMADGMYQLVSAFGDTADSVKILELNAKAARAGVATVSDAINLSSAVMKGYGDVSAKANEKVLDLAFTTVKLGQTTFPELAASMGQVIPMASALGVAQEELFAGFATLTGVTGGTSEVATQFRAVLTAMMKPTADMSKAIKSLGYETSQAMLKNLGMVGSLKALIGTTNGTMESVAGLFGRAEALNAIFALTGSQADVFQDKLRELAGASGATDEAFKEQADGINALGFAFEQMKTRATVAMQNIGDTLKPFLSGVAIPLFSKLMSTIETLSRAFADLPAPIQATVVAVASLTAAVGPLLWMIGSVSTGISALVPLLAKVSGLLGVAGLAGTAGALAGGLALLTGGIAAVGAGFLAWKIYDRNREAKEYWKSIEVGAKKADEFAKELEKVGIHIDRNGLSAEQWVNKISRIKSEMEATKETFKQFNMEIMTAPHAMELARISFEEATGKISKQTADMLRAQIEGLKELARQQGGASGAISETAEEVRKLLYPMDELSARFATFSADGMSAEQAIKLYSREIVNAADMQRLLTGRLTETQQALAAKARVYADLTAQRDSSKFSLLDYTGVLETYNDALFRNAELLDQAKAAEAARNELFKVQIPEGLWPEDPIARDPQRKKSIDEMIRDVMNATEEARKAQDGYNKSMSVFGREVSTIFTNMAQSIAENIIQWKGWASTILNTIKSLAKAALSTLIQGLFTPILNWLNKLMGGSGGGIGGGIGNLASAFGGKALGGLFGIGGAASAAGVGTAAAGTTAAGATLGAGLAGSGPVAVGGGLAAGTTAGGFSLGGALAGVGGAIQGGATAAMGAMGLGFLPAAAAIPVVGAIAAGAGLGISKLVSWAKGPNAWQAASKEVKRDYGVTMSDKQIAAFFQSMGISESTAWGIRWPLLKSPQFQAYMLALGKSPSMSKQGDDYKAAHELAKLGDWSAYNELFLNEFGNIHSGALSKITGWYDKLTVASSAMGEIPKYQSGIDFVPRDGLAYLHRGERVTPANENKSVNVRLGDMHLTFNVGGTNTADMVQTFRNQIIPILKREMQGGPTGLREAIRAANATTARAY